MRRRRARAALLVALAVALAGLGWRFWQRLVAQPQRALEALGSELLPHVAQHLRNFRRVKVKNGRMVWEVTAREAQYLEADREIVVEGPQLTLWLEDGQRALRLGGARGRLQLDGRELRAASLEGDVRLVFDDFELRTARAVYDRSADRILVPGAVTVKGRDLDLRAQSLEVEVTPQVLRFTGEVHTVVQVANAERTS